MESKKIIIPIHKNLHIYGDLALPENAKALVLVIQGSGSSRFSARNQYIAQLLNKEKMATLLVDLLTEAEDKFIENHFNIELLTARLIAATAYVHQLPQLNALSIGYYAANTGTAAAIKGAVKLKNIVKAIVSRGGRLDLAKASILELQTPILLIMGSSDTEIIEINEQAYSLINCEKRIEIIPTASGLFNEPDTLHNLTELTTDWFGKKLCYEEVAEEAFA